MFHTCIRHMLSADPKITQSKLFDSQILIISVTNYTRSHRHRHKDRRTLAETLSILSLKNVIFIESNMSSHIAIWVKHPTPFILVTKLFSLITIAYLNTRDFHWNLKQISGLSIQQQQQQQPEKKHMINDVISEMSGY